MPSTLAGFGLKPDFQLSGIVRPWIYSITSGYATGILTNQPVKIVPSSTGEGTIAAAAVGDRFIGTFQGCKYLDTNGVEQFSPQWIASTSATNIEAYVSLDPWIIYQIQSDDTLTVADIGKQYDFNVASGSTTTGLSSMTLDVASVANNASLQIMGLTPGPDNAWGDAYPIVLVRVSEHQFVADIASF